jgi:hypothetical protein
MAGDLKRMYSDILANYPGDYTVKGVIEDIATALLAEHRIGNHAVYFQLASWCPKLIGSNIDEMLAATLTEEDARITVAREHGFVTWDQIEEMGDVKFDKDFEHAATAVVTGDLVLLRSLLQSNPDLIRMVSLYGHKATLLHYVAANGVETWRQEVPANAVDITRTLIDFGADVEAKAVMYGGLQRTIGLLLSSSHPAEAGLTEDIAKVLRGASKE